MYSKQRRTACFICIFRHSDATNYTRTHRIPRLTGVRVNLASITHATQTHTICPFSSPSGHKFSYLYDWLVNAMDAIPLYPSHQ